MFGLVTDESFESQLESLKPRVNSDIKTIEKGRGSVKEVPVEIKKIISENSIKGTPAKELSELFKISESSISAYKNDATSTSTYNEPDKELKESNDLVRTEITSSARSKLLLALESITPEKLQDAKVRDAASVAKDMSAVIRNIEPQKNEGGQVNQQFIFYAPKPRLENDFEVVEEAH